MIQFFETIGKALTDLPWLELKVKYTFDLIYRAISFFPFKSCCFETAVVFQTLEVVVVVMEKFAF
jgi:hypothetical protein